MLQFESTTVIAASPKTIWAILTDLSGFPSWDPNCIKIEGTLNVGEALTILSQLSPNRAFKAKVVSMDPEREMVWQGGMPLGMFRGTRTFEIEGLEDGTTRFTTREAFTGWMSPLINKTIPDMTEPFDQFTAGMKRVAESREAKASA